MAVSGMNVGTLAGVAAVVGIDAVRRFGSLKGSIAVLGAWLCVAGSPQLLRGAVNFASL
jgi:hypothetical protein